MVCLLIMHSPDRYSKSGQCRCKLRRLRCNRTWLPTGCHNEKMRKAAGYKVFVFVFFIVLCVGFRVHVLVTMMMTQPLQWWFREWWAFQGHTEWLVIQMTGQPHCPQERYIIHSGYTDDTLEIQRETLATKTQRYWLGRGARIPLE